MPDFYRYPKDGKFHTRYSELVRCSNDKQAIKIAELRAGVAIPRSNSQMDFGKQRHEMFKEESLKTGKTPQVFKDNLGFQLKVVDVEMHKATELFEDVVIHFTTDAFCKPADVVDYKTTSSNGFSYSQTPQGMLYALLMIGQGYDPKKVHYLIERWDRERTQVLKYYHFEKKVTLRELSRVKKWCKQRVELLWAAQDLVAENNPRLTDNGSLDILSVY